MLVKSVTSNITRIFAVANNLQQVRKILKRFCKSSFLNNMLCNLFVTQKIKLKMYHARDRKMYITRCFKKGSHS